MLEPGDSERLDNAVRTVCFDGDDSVAAQHQESLGAIEESPPDGKVESDNSQDQENRAVDPNVAQTLSAPVKTGPPPAMKASPPASLR